MFSRRLGTALVGLLVGPQVASCFVGTTVPACCNPFSVHHRQQQCSTTKTSSTALGMAGPRRGLSARELEIRRKIKELKRQQKSKQQQDDDDDADDFYARKVQEKLGATKSKLLGFESTASSGEDDDDAMTDQSAEQDSSAPTMRRTARIGALPRTEIADEVVDYDVPSSNDKDSSSSRIRIDPSLFDDGSSSSKEEMPEEDLVDLVAQKMTEERDRKLREERQQLKEQARERLQQLEEERLQQQQASSTTSQSTTNNNNKPAGSQKLQTTTGVGGSWDRNSTSAQKGQDDVYQPKTGSWGAFPRPRDISKAYGGGRRVGPGYSNEKAKLDSAAATRERLQQYREKVGIEVPSEKEHASEIDQALQISYYAMQRGVYGTAVSALEKVTKYCSTNSKVGGKVFLELAMAYEAVGRTTEAMTVYRTLSNCRIEEIKYNAKRLLYGIEAMHFMRDNVKSSEFSRKKAKNTFIDTTGLANIAQNFDDVYNTAYIDLDRGFYKRLTESVVRTPREARQILLRATAAGEVDRLRIVQALRSLSRRFDDALEEEISTNHPVGTEESVAVMNGKPILGTTSSSSSSSRTKDISQTVSDLDEFVLTSPEQMKDNLAGEWRLQLLADKKGDGVKFFNTTCSWQNIDMEDGSFTSEGSNGFLTVQQSGRVDFVDKRRILRRKSVQVSGGGGGMLAGLLGATRTGAGGAVSAPHQVMTVDSVLLVTRRLASKRSKSADEDKDFFAVWRRVEGPGAWSGETSTSSSRNTARRSTIPN